MSNRRQLSAIMFTDIEGYTALMQEDELTAKVLRDKLHKALEQGCRIYNGRIIQWSGDGALCIFNSAIEAVRAATEIQTQMNIEPKVPLRIGIHSGDIVFEENNIYGDGVNIASRIESFAVTGGVFISGRVYDDIKNQKDIEAISFGKYDLKNVKEPVEIYAIINSGLIIPTNEKLEGKGALTSNKKFSSKKILFSIAVIVLLIVSALLVNSIFLNPPTYSNYIPKSIAVLPFANLSASKDDEYFTDGMCDEILTQLSKIGELKVMSRTSTLQYKDTKKTMKEIGDELGADVLLEGSVQKSNDKLRINVQLIDSKNDEHLWAETYDREMKDVFAIQTDIAKQIATALNTTLTEKEKSLVDEIPTANLLAYDFFLKGNKYADSFWDYSRLNEISQAVRMYEEAIRLDRKFTASYSALIELCAGISWSKPFLHSEEYRIKAKEWLDQMLVQNIDDAHTQYAIAIYKYKAEKDYETALAKLNVVDKMLGNGKSTYMLRADILRRTGRIDEALGYLKKQADLFPKQARFWSELAETYKLKRNFDSSVFYINKAIAINPDVVGFYVNKSMYYAELKGDLAKASSVLKNSFSLVDTNEFKYEFIYFEILKGNYADAIQLAAQNKDSLGILWQYKIVPKDLIIALMHHVKGRNVQAKLYFQKTYNLILPLSIEYPQDFRIHAVLGIVLAGLGEKEKALQEGSRACDLMPVSKDAIIGISPLESLALIHTLLGEHDAAVDILQQMLTMPFAWTMSNSVPLYKMFYYWKPLQGNRRFRQMIQG